MGDKYTPIVENHAVSTDLVTKCPDLGRELVLEAEHGQEPRLRLRARFAIYLTESFYEVALQKSVPAQIRQRVLYICCNEG